MTARLLSMRMAFLRGAARQNGGLTATYRSCNFGDSSTIFSETGRASPKPRNILDNYYSVFSGAGMTWYKMDIWYQYMAGSSMFYHEQGFDEFWMPGGTTAAGLKEVQLSPKGKVGRSLPACHGRAPGPRRRLHAGGAFWWIMPTAGIRRRSCRMRLATMPTGPI